MTAVSPLERLPTYERRLPNGLTVVVREDPSAPVVAIVTHVKAGYFDEPDGLIGVSHVLEHMYFRGTRERAAGEIARITKSAGGYLNASTIYDSTTYSAVLPSDSLELGLELQADALRNCAFAPDELQRELEVIVEEARRKLDDPRAIATEALYATMFDVHRIRRWRIGTEEQIRGIRREDVVRYHRELYRPSNIVIAVVGALDPDRTLEQVERYYGGMPAGTAVQRSSPREPENEGTRYREIRGAVTSSRIEWGWRSPGALEPDTPALDLLSTVLGQGRASRLYRNVRETGLVSSIGAYHYTPTEVGVFGIHAEVEPEDEDAMIQAVAREVERVQADTVDHDELARARNIFEAGFLRKLETVEGQATLLADWQALGDWRLASAYLRQALTTTVEELHDVALRYLAPERMTVLEYRPHVSTTSGRSTEWYRWWSRGEHAPAEAQGTVQTLRKSRAPDPRARAGDGGRRAVAPRRRAPARASEAVGGTSGAHLYTPADGVTFVVVPRRSTPLVSMGVVTRGGALHESVEEAGITALMARTSIKGTRTRSAVALAEETESLAGAIVPSVGPDLMHWSLGLPSRHFDRGVSLLADVVLRPSFPSVELERERVATRTNLVRLRNNMYRYPLRLFIETAFEGHPYGYSTDERGRSLQRLTRDDVVSWHSVEVLRRPRLVIVVGDVDPDDAAATLEREFCGPDTRPIVEASAEPRPIVWPQRPGPRIERRDKEQTAIVVGFPGPKRNDPDSHAMQVMAHAIGGLGGRLFEELRSRRTLAYAVAAYPITRWCGGAFVGYIGTSPDREAEAREGLISEFERLAEERLSPDDVERAQRYTIGAWTIRSQTNGARLGDMAYALLLGAGLDELRTFEDRIRAVTPSMIRDAVERFYDPDRRVEAVVRGEVGEQEPALESELDQRVANES